MANPPKLYIPVPTPVVDRERHITRDWVLLFDQLIARVFASGTVVGPTTSVDNAITLFSGTSGQILKAATGTGVVHATSGVYSAADVTLAELTPATAASRLLGRGSAGGAGDFEELTLGSGLGLTGTVLSASHTGTLGLVIDGGGAVITTGVKGFFEVGVACTIIAATLLSSDAAVTSGSIVVDIWKDTYANYPPTVADTITASAKPTLSSATKSRDTTLTGWTTAIAAGDILAFNVDSASTVTKVSVLLTVQL